MQYSPVIISKSELESIKKRLIQPKPIERTKKKSSISDVSRRAEIRKQMIEKEKMDREKQQQQIDADWAAIVESEKLAARERAKMLQYLNSNDGFQESSKLHMVNVLKELDLQKKDKARRNYMLEESKLKDRVMCERMTDDYLCSVKVQQNNREETNAKHYNFLKRQEEEKNLKKHENDMDEQSLLEMDSKCFGETRQKEFDLESKKRQALNESLRQTILEKQRLNDSSERRITDDDQKNTKFLTLKEDLLQKINLMNRSKVQTHQVLTDHVLTDWMIAKELDETHKTSFIDKISSQEYPFRRG
ncbi:hypothetical protein O9G_004355 [Rozella allomycis CSF55]|uniref:Uncharacterized protein n=1 Tax=Rozella allomycis (strain CSF55) TaxID=988480 RepID=A0A075AXG8_ROZAC|nr:hypothetical protein O9G_004355 [Rozella allomycis CSF55]|eukprot:EPZ35005.1 hypothetical protein O9G_004355 [Rozella allomycis CSF55]